MKPKIILVLLILGLFTPIIFLKAAETTNNLKGRILLQVESRGEAWYINPKDGRRYFMANGNEAFQIMKTLGVGISNKDLDRVKTDVTYRKKFIGKILLQVESRGEAYYISFDGRYNYLKDGTSAYELMKKLGLGISNKDLGKIVNASQTSADSYRLDDFSIKYIFDQNFAFKNYLSSDCVKNYYGRFENTYRDMNLMRKGEVLIPNLKELINSTSVTSGFLAENCYDYELELFSYYSEKQIIFLKLSLVIEGDAPYSGLSGLYKLDIRTKSISSLPLSAGILSKIDSYRGLSQDATYILPDNKRVIKWDRSNIYLINLETDRSEILYTVPLSTWLISELSFEMGHVASYNIKIKDNNILVGLYDKQIDTGGQAIKLNESDDGAIEPNLSEEDWGKTINPKFIKNIVVPILVD